MDAQARVALDRAEAAAARQDIALSEDELTQDESPQPPLDSHSPAQPLFPAKSAVLDFLTDTRRVDPTLSTATLAEQCYDHFRLQDLGTTLEEFHPHVAGLNDEGAMEKLTWPPEEIGALVIAGLSSIVNRMRGGIHAAAARGHQ
jgi:hypothetical protein